MEGKFQFLALFIICLAMRQSNSINHPNKISNRCTRCPPGWGVTKKCTRDSDTECAKCIQGRTYSPHSSSKSPCWLCSQCGIGLFESHGCSPVRDTICSECVSYLDHKNLTMRFEGEFVNDFNTPTGILECKGQSLQILRNH